MLLTLESTNRAGLPFAHPESFFRNIGIGAGAFAFGFLLGVWSFKRIERTTEAALAEGKRRLEAGELKPGLEEGERPLSHWNANLRQGLMNLSSVAVFLTLTNQNLRCRTIGFKLGPIEQGSRVHCWPLTAIRATERYRVSWIFPSGVELQLEDGDRVRFAVSMFRREAFLSALDQARAEAQFGGPTAD